MIIQCILGVKRASLFSLIPAMVSWTSPALPHSSPDHSESRGSCLSKSGLLSTFILPVSHSNLTWLSGFWTSVHIWINWGAFGDLLAMPIKLESSGMETRGMPSRFQVLFSFIPTSLFPKTLVLGCWLYFQASQLKFPSNLNSSSLSKPMDSCEVTLTWH